MGGLGQLDRWMSWRERLCLDSPGCLGLGGEQTGHDAAVRRGSAGSRQQEGPAAPKRRQVQLGSVCQCSRLVVSLADDRRSDRKRDSGRPESAREVARDLVRARLAQVAGTSLPCVLARVRRYRYKMAARPLSVIIHARSAQIIHQSYITPPT